MRTLNKKPIVNDRRTETPTRPVRQVYPKTAIRRPSAGVEAIALGDMGLGDKDMREKKRLILLFFEITLLLVLAVQSAIFINYLIRPRPLPELLPNSVSLSFPPHYVFSIYNVDEPVSVATSPDGDRIYVAEMGGERLIKIFDHDGNQLASFAPPRTEIPERSPVYLAVSQDGKVFASDRAQHSIYVFDALGNYLDTILSPTLTLSEFVSKHTEGLAPGTKFEYSVYDQAVYYQKPGESEQSIPGPDIYDWAPLGLRIDAGGRLFITDVAENRSVIQYFSQIDASSEFWNEFDPAGLQFGEFGDEAGNMSYPNSAVVDSMGRIFVSDSNNSRIAVWDNQGNFLFNFGRGTGDGALSLPRGLAIDERQRLYVVDAVGQSIKVFDVTNNDVAFLFSFGDFGMQDGEFNYPNDIALDKTGRLYVADRENNRIQVWLY